MPIKLFVLNVKHANPILRLNFCERKGRRAAAKSALRGPKSYECVS